MELRQPVPGVARQVEVLIAAGLVERTGDRPDNLRARFDRVGELARGLAALESDAPDDPAGGLIPGAWPHDGETFPETVERMAATPEDVRVLRSFLVDGRLSSIPAQHRKRQVVLRFLLERVFTEDRDYPEKEVNQRLALFHPDVAALRRYLVDDGFVTREAGRYRRAPDFDPPRRSDV